MKYINNVFNSRFGIFWLFRIILLSYIAVVLGASLALLLKGSVFYKFLGLITFIIATRFTKEVIEEKLIGNV